MKIDELFNSNIESDSLPHNIKLNLANDEHVDAVVALMHERNPNDSLEDLKLKTLKEIELNKTDP